LFRRLQPEAIGVTSERRPRVASYEGHYGRSPDGSRIRSFPERNADELTGGMENSEVGRPAHAGANRDSSFFRQDCRAPLRRQRCDRAWGSEESGLPTRILLNRRYIMDFRGRQNPLHRERYVGVNVGGSGLNLFGGSPSGTPNRAAAVSGRWSRLKACAEIVSTT
jgi:hypothetical protein